MSLLAVLYKLFSDSLRKYDTGISKTPEIKTLEKIAIVLEIDIKEFF
ncbi:hypothetical protein [Clostridium beijerinckii]|nr:hypothetical protein [Clostridium beijerinckii]NRY59525.1 hypothetical protein [Clostridium beijerinckii]